MPILDLGEPPASDYVKVATFGSDGICNGYKEGFENAIALALPSDWTTWPWQPQWLRVSDVPPYSELTNG